MAVGSLCCRVLGEVWSPLIKSGNPAFGIFARALPEDTDEFLTLRAQTAGLELADSITVDGHKILNVVRAAFDVKSYFHCLNLPL